jgi:hypothetical protein
VADRSYQGVAFEIDGIMEIGHLYITAGANTLNFKWVDLNAGFGFFF